MVDVLRGARKTRLLEFGHDKLSVHGIAAAHPEDELKELFAALVDRGFLARSSGEYATIYVTGEGRDFLRRRDTLSLKKPEPAAAPTPRSGQQTLDYDAGLFERLRALRKRLADEKDVPAFVVFGDASLREMAHYAPQSVQSFGAIGGVGDRKLATYGDVFVAEIRAYAAEEDLDERPLPPRRTVGNTRSGRQTGATHEETKTLVLEGLNVGEIAQRRGISQQTVLNHLERLAAAGERLELAHLMPPEHRFRRIQGAFRAVGGERLTPVAGLPRRPLLVRGDQARSSLALTGRRLNSQTRCFLRTKPEVSAHDPRLLQSEGNAERL